MYNRNLFPERLRKARTDAKETQRMLGQYLNVSHNQVSEMELGNKTTSFENLAKICEHYNISADYLLGLIDNPRPLKEGKET